jgi:MFS family permease
MNDCFLGIGWNEGSVGAALSLMGLTALLVQPLAGDWVDKATFDRRIFLAVASVVTALSASTILLVREGNTDHMVIFVSKVIEGVASSFIGPCLAALTLATFGPHHFDAVMASNILWGHIGSVVAAILAGGVAYLLYPQTKYCFLVIGASALVAILFVQYLPQGDPLMGRGFQGKVAMDEDGHLEQLGEENDTENRLEKVADDPKASSYWEVFFDLKTGILCVTGFFFQYVQRARCNWVDRVIVATTDSHNALPQFCKRQCPTGSRRIDGWRRRWRSKEVSKYVFPRQSPFVRFRYISHARSLYEVPLIAGAIVTAQVTMAIATLVGDRLTEMGVGRKPLFIAGLLSLPIRCALIIWWKDAGDAFLLSTQVLDGIGGGLLGLLHPYLVADITFGTGRFNVVSTCIL